jgi:hypothetical protein
MERETSVHGGAGGQVKSALNHSDWRGAISHRQPLVWREAAPDSHGPAGASVGRGRRMESVSRRAGNSIFGPTMIETRVSRQIGCVSTSST